MNFIEFLQGEGTDSKGRTFQDYVEFSPEQWEDCHDHMQWAFPTRTVSAYNPNAPAVPEDYIFQYEQEVQSSIFHLLERYLDSLNINIEMDRVIGCSIGWKADEDDYVLNPWVGPRNHNMLRMTRVLEALGIFEMEDAQEALFNFLIYDIAVNHSDISATTVAFWVAAKENKLHLLR